MKYQDVTPKHSLNTGRRLKSLGKVTISGVGGAVRYGQKGHGPKTTGKPVMKSASCKGRGENETGL